MKITAPFFLKPHISIVKSHMKEVLTPEKRKTSEVNNKFIFRMMIHCWTFKRWILTGNNE